MRLSTISALLYVAAAHSIDTSLETYSNLLSARGTCKRSISCILNVEVMEGPFYVAEPLVRSSIVEDREGAPLSLEIEVLDVRTCEPADGVYVDIWHADAGGVYSGWATGDSLQPFDAFPASSDDSSVFDLTTYNHDAGLKKRGIPVEDSRWLRGVQRTRHGKVEFETIVPGWYNGRADHIHLRIHASNSSVVDGHLLGGPVSHTGQLFFDDSFVDSIRSDVAPYNTRNTKPKLNMDDSLFRDLRGEEQLVKISKKSDGTFTGKIVVGIDPSKVQPPSKGPGGPPGHGPPGRGPPGHGPPGHGPPGRGGPPDHKDKDNVDGTHPILQNAIMVVFVVLIVGAGVWLIRWYRSSRAGYETISDEQ